LARNTHVIIGQLYGQHFSAERAVWTNDLHALTQLTSRVQLIKFFQCIDVYCAKPALFFSAGKLGFRTEYWPSSVLSFRGLWSVRRVENIFGQKWPKRDGFRLFLHSCTLDKHCTSFVVSQLLKHEDHVAHDEGVRSNWSEVLLRKM